jgi:choline-sulfatase
MILRPRRALVASILAAAGFGAGCRPAEPPPPERFPGAPVILVSIDTLRADRVGAHGYAQARTPRLDALAREGILFEETYSHCPLTLPAHASLFTGLLPPRHGVRDNVGFTLAPEHRTLATRLKAAGWSTGGAVSAFVLRSPTGIGQGFDFFEDAIEIQGSTEALGSLQREGALTVDALSGWVAQQGARPLFAFLHLYEPHTPYRPPAAYRDLASPYDGDVAQADELLGRFLDRLRAGGLYDRAVIAVTSDHGEGLSQHGEEEHGIFLYKEALHVPFVLRLPGGVRGGTRVTGTVGTVDITATLLDLVGQTADGIDGRSRRAALGTGAVAAQPVYAETLYPRYHFGWSELFAVTEGRLRYVEAPRPELYDLGEDPGETRNRVAERAAAVSGMKQWLHTIARPDEVAQPGAVSAEVRERLQALGYLSAGAVNAVDATGPRPDPKDKIGVYHDLKRALALREAGRDEEAVAAFRKVVAENPTFLDAWENLGFTLIRMGKTREGIAAVDRALAVDPGRLSAHLALARVHALEGNLERAIRHAEVAADRNPGQAFELLAQMMMDKNDLRRAEALARRSVDADPRRIMGHFILGVAEQRAGRYEAALSHFQAAEKARRLQRGTRVFSLHANIGDCLARLGRDREAEEAFRREIAEIPGSEAGRVGLAMLYRAQGRNHEAREVLGGLVTAQPKPDPNAYNTVVRTFLVLGDTPAAADFAGRARQMFPGDARFVARARNESGPGR